MPRGPTKPCRQCSKPVARRAHHTADVWKRGPFCNKQCCAAWRFCESRAAMASNRACQVCGEILRPRVGELPSRFLLRTTCGDMCKIKLGAEHRRKATPKKTCVVCGQRLIKKGYEAPVEYMRRQTCGHNCVGRLARPRILYDVMGVKLSQGDLASMLGVSQSRVCTLLKQGGLPKILKLLSGR